MLSSSDATDEPEETRLKYISSGETTKPKPIAAIGTAPHISNFAGAELGRVNPKDRIDALGIV